jgi:hypothetical protein
MKYTVYLNDRARFIDVKPMTDGCNLRIALGLNSYEKLFLRTHYALKPIKDETPVAMTRAPLLFMTEFVAPQKCPTCERTVNQAEKVRRCCINGHRLGILHEEERLLK